MYFRPLDLRSNKRQLFNISWYNVFRDRDPNIDVSPDYSVVSILHRYNNSDAVNVFSTNSNLELSKKAGIKTTVRVSLNWLIVSFSASVQVKLRP